MALAILRFAGADGGRVRFDVELGTNRFYGYAIGDGETDRSRGFAVLRNRSFASPLIGPLPEHTLGRTRLEIPRERFDRDNRYVQLLSYRTAELHGPAISEVMEVPAGGAVPDELPPIVFGMGYHMATHMQRSRPVALTYRERPPMSSAMFLNQLLPLLSQIVPVVGSLLGGGGGGGGGRRSNGGGTVTQTRPARQSVISPETLRLVQQLIEQIGAASRGESPAPAPAAQALGRTNPYSHAAVAPALLAALPALMPLLQQVLNPETVQALLGHLAPDKLIGAVTDSVTQIGRLGLEHNKEENEHLRALNPGVDDPALDQLLAGMGIAAGAEPASAEPRYRRVKSVTFDFLDLTPLPVHGRSRLCYRDDREIGFPLAVETRRPIPGGRILLLVKEPASRKVLIRRRFELPETPSGRLDVIPTLRRAEVAQLRAGEDYLVCVHLLWKNRAGKTIGTGRSQLITLVGEYLFDRVEEAGELIPLSDVQQHRDFWHKVWQGTFSDQRRSVEFDCKYYFALEGERQENVRMETLTRTEKEGLWKEVGRLKSGLIVSPLALNRLIPLLSDESPLGDAELSALRSPDFVDRFSQAARFKASMRGRDGTSAALWVFPEVKLQRVVLQQAQRTNAAGHVEELAEYSVRFPMPALLHYIGARTEQ